MQFKKICEKRERLLDLLLIADPEVEVVLNYMNRGTMIGLYSEKEYIGVIHFEEIEKNIVEINNIGIIESYRGKGIGKIILQYAISYIRSQGYSSIVLGTGNSSISNIAFYQKCGFNLVELWSNYFLENYTDPIFEDDIQCKHMLRFEYSLIETSEN